MTIPLDASGLNFRAGPGFGRAARAFYSVKQLKTAFRAGLGPKIFRGLQDLCPRPSSKVRGRAWRGPGRGGLKMLRYTCQVGELRAEDQLSTSHLDGDPHRVQVSEVLHGQLGPLPNRI
jgi:hypothetical protein